MIFILCRSLPFKILYFERRISPKFISGLFPVFQIIKEKKIKLLNINFPRIRENASFFQKMEINDECPSLRQRNPQRKNFSDFFFPKKKSQIILQLRKNLKFFWPTGPDLPPLKKII